VNAEFQWWLLILGIVIGGGLVYLVMADLRRDDDQPALADVPASDEDPDGDTDGAEPDPLRAPVPDIRPSIRSVPRDPDVERDRAEGQPAVADLP
jgi:hypothetical protein